MKNIFTKEYIESIPKIINENGCWIPTKNKPDTDGYVRLTRGLGKRGLYVRYKLHRIVLCVYYNIDYDDKKLVSRHNKNCSRACFFHEHLKPGSDSDNCNDMVEHGTHNNSRKEVCPKCNSPYRNGRRIKNNRVVWVRRCPICG